MSPFSRSLMKHKHIDDRSPGFYDPERVTPQNNFIIVSIFCILMGGGFWIALTQTLDAQQRQHCEQGWQPACEKLK
jgi:hypothetical protein